MPFYNWRRKYYPRRRRAWRRRPRRTFFNRLWRRKRYRKRRYRVRRLKLRSILLREYQPPNIRKMKCKGTIPLFITTDKTISHNFSMYVYNTVPHLHPNGGGFSIICFKLSAFYQLFKKVMCFWTHSNDTMPLIKYTGCRIKLYHSEHTDYIATYHNCYPMNVNLDTYNSTHPSILQLNNRHKIMPCRKNRRNRRPYTIIKVGPPSQMIKKWYFQSHLADSPLLMLMVASMSLDRYYAYSNSRSTTIGFKTINTTIFDFHNWKQTLTSGYKAKEGIYLWALKNGQLAIKDEPVKNLIFLGQTSLYTEGKRIIDTKTTTENWQTTLQKYTSSSTNWGNPFMPKYLNEEVTILITQKSPHDISEHYSNKGENATIGTGVFDTPTTKLLIDCRYNPLSDNGNNHIFLEPINEVGPSSWKQPTDARLTGNPYPLWLSGWGFTDWQKNRLGEKADTDYVCILVSDHIIPKIGFYLPIDEDFLHGRSPFGEDNSIPIFTDQTHWQPKVRFQYTTLNTIFSTGPGTIKLAPDTTAEAHADFTFYFKLGGCGPPTNTIEDPEKQPDWTVPNNLIQQPSLQSPTTPFESFLYNFDWRRDFITKRATQRLLKIEATKEPYASITDSNLLLPTPVQEETSEDSTEETEKEALLQLIQQQRDKQHKFRQRILQLMTQLNSE
nr:MAG: ORF1 [TTV-like mini virus]